MNTQQHPQQQRLLLIDTFNFLHRAYYALPKSLSDSEGNPTNAIYGVTTMLLTILDVVEPTYVVAAMESKEPVKRFERFNEYKANRKPMDYELEVQIKGVVDILKAFNIKCVSYAGYEADDVIGTFASSAMDHEITTIIASNDRDLWQLVNKATTAFIPRTKGVSEWIGPNEVFARMGLTPDQIVDYKALRGDPSDNIPGIKGVGEKTASQLLTRYKTVEEIYKNLESIEQKKRQKKTY